MALTGSITGSNVTVSGTGVFNESSTGVIGGTGSTFTLTAGTATLAGQNTYNGGTTFTAGTLNIAADGTGTSGPLGTGTLTLSTGGTLQATGGAHAIANAVVNGGTSAVVGGSNNLTFNGIYTTNTSGTILTVNNTGLTTFAGGINIRPDNQAIRTTSFAGSGNVLVSGVVADGLTGASGGVLGYQGTGTLTLTAANTYTGSTTITSGTVQLGNGGTAGSLNVNAGIADAGTFTINRSNAISQATSFGTISGTGAVSLIGTGTTAFTKANTYTGVTTINRGALDLGGSTTTGSIGTVTAGNGSGGGLVLGGGALSFTRTGTNTQAFSGTTLNSGGSGITSAVSTDTIALGAITRNSGGTVNFAGPGVITTPTANTATSILGGWATYGSNDWAVSAGNGTTAGNITALPNASYFTYNNVSGLVGAGAGGTNLTDDTTGYDGTYTANLTVNSLRFNASGGDGNFGVVSGNNLTVTSGGILVTNNVGSKYQRIGFLNGSYIAGQGQGGLTTSATDLVINQNNSGGGHLEIYSAIFGGLNLVKSGVGYFELRGLDASYTGSTVVNGGTMQLTAATTGTTSVVVNSGTLLLGANDRINDAATVTLNGGTINTGGSKEGNATGSSAATAGLGALTLSTSSTLDFGSGHTGSSVLAFGASNTQTWNGILTLLDFTPGTDFLNFASSTGLTATQLGEISLAGFSATGLDSFGDVTFTAVPEPATVFGGVFVVGALGWHLRRRNRRQSA